MSGNVADFARGKSELATGRVRPFGGPGLAARSRIAAAVTFEVDRRCSGGHVVRDFVGSAADTAAATEDENRSHRQRL